MTVSVVTETTVRGRHTSIYEPLVLRMDRYTFTINRADTTERYDLPNDLREVENPVGAPAAGVVDERLHGRLWVRLRAAGGCHYCDEGSKLIGRIDY